MSQLQPITNSFQFPKLRPLEPVRLVYEGRPSFILRDPLEISQQSVVLPVELLPLVYLCDGNRDLSTIQTILTYHFHVDVDPHQLQNVFSIFDQMYLLENRRSNQAKKHRLQAYRARNFRQPANAGKTYPEDPENLHTLLENYLADVDVEPETQTGYGLLSPHIDFERGGSAYAKVWKTASKMVSDADVIIILGTDHFGGQQPITLTQQNYATPYGILHTERHIVEQLAKTIGEENVYAGELYHQNEHSIELVSVWLHHMIQKNPRPIVPILCGGLYTNIYENVPVSQNTLIEKFVEKLQELLINRNAFIVVSGDLSHVGPAFDGEPIGKEEKEKIKKEDQELLNIAKTGNAIAFISKIQQTKNKNNICGTTPLYLGMRLMGNVTGQVIDYQQCPADVQDTSIVSICGMVFK